MFGFFWKKNIADKWDNVIHFLIVNVLTMLVPVLAAVALVLVNALPLAEGATSLLFLAVLLLACIAFHVLLFAESRNIVKMVSFEAPKLRGFFEGIVPSLKIGTQYALTVALLLAVAVFGIPFYLSLWLPGDGSGANILGALGLMFVFWFEVVSLLSMQWFIPIHGLLGNGYLKCLKKSYMVFFDNVWFSVGVCFVNVLSLLATVFTFGMFPGVHGWVLTVTEAFRLRLYKYDWYEVNPGMSKEVRQEVPWDDLLANDRRMFGKHTWRTFLFPWKE